MSAVLTYGGTVVAYADDPNVLLTHKARSIVRGEYRYPSMLAITIDGKSWVFDRIVKDKATAMEHLGNME